MSGERPSYEWKREQMRLLSQAQRRYEATTGRVLTVDRIGALNARRGAIRYEQREKRTSEAGAA